MKQMKFLRRDSPTWTNAWRYVVSKYGDERCEDLETGEVWQYMGSVIHCSEPEETTAVDVEHQFRHRSMNGKREDFSAWTHFNMEDYT